MAHEIAEIPSATGPIAYLVITHDGGAIEIGASSPVEAERRFFEDYPLESGYRALYVAVNGFTGRVRPQRAA